MTAGRRPPPKVDPPSGGMVILMRAFAFGPASLAVAAVALSGGALAAGDPLPSWNDGPSKSAILEFVAATTGEGTPEFVPAADRIAVFDNDGTLWCERPAYVQAVFVRDRVRALAVDHPEWREEQPFRALLEGDGESLAAVDHEGVVDLVSATHAGMTTDEFRAIVDEWIAVAEHPRFKRPYTRCVYQPMLELLAFLKDRGFTTYIVSGGGVEFIRAWSEPVYGIPADRVIGSTIRTTYELRGDVPVLARLPEVDYVNDGAGKPVCIGKFIGKRPIAAFGNSDGDREMLRYSTSGAGRRLGLIVRHTDAEREYAYDRASPIGRLDRALDEAAERNWTVVDMARDWKTVFPDPPRRDPRP